MNTDELTDLIRQRGKYDTAETTRGAIEAVLTVLATRHMDGEAAKLAAQLPSGIGEYLREPEEKPEEFDAEEFLARVQKQLDSNDQQAQTATHAVLSAVTEVVSEGEQISFMNALPNDLSGYARWN